MAALKPIAESGGDMGGANRERLGTEIAQHMQRLHIWIKFTIFLE